MTTTPSDETLYRRVLAGDVAALETLVPRYHGPLLGFLFRMTGDRHLAEDLVQETFTRLVTYQGTPPERFRPWAYAIARNLAHDHYRSASRRWHQSHTSLTDADDGSIDVPDPDPDALERLVHADQRRIVADALQRLPAHQREAVILRFFHDLTVPEIAEATDVALGTAKSRLFHGLKRLKEWLGPEATPTTPYRLIEKGGAHDPAAPAGPSRRSLA